MQCGICSSKINLFENVSCGYNCGCIFKTSCVEEKQFCPVHGSNSPLRKLGLGGKCLIETCTGSSSNSSICPTCAETVTVKITSIFTALTKPHLNFRQLFTALFVDSNTSIWPPFCLSSARFNRGQLSLCIDPDSGSLNTVRLKGSSVQMPVVLAHLWQHIMLLLLKISSVIIFKNQLWYSPVFLYNQLKQRKIGLYTVEQLLYGTSIKPTAGLIHVFRCWIRTHGCGSSLVKICTDKDGLVVYRKITKYNILSKSQLLTAICNNSTGIPITELYGEHPDAAMWLDELAENVVIISNRVFERVSFRTELQPLKLTFIDGIPLLRK